MSFFQRIRASFARFMYGRYGIDEFYKFLFSAYFIFVLLNLITRSAFVSIICYALLLVMFFRMFSKNIYKRSLENQKYIKIKDRVKSFFALQKNRIKDRKTHIYRHCSHCKAVLRLPKKKGKHTVRCPKCNKSFELKV